MAMMCSPVTWLLVILCLKDAHLSRFAGKNIANTTCDVDLVRSSCDLELLKGELNDLHVEAESTAHCIINDSQGLDQKTIGNSSLEGLEEDDGEAFRCLVMDVQRILKCSENVTAPDTSIMGLFFDGTLDNELNGSGLYGHNCSFCFVAQFHMILEINLRAINYDVKSCQFFSDPMLNITVWNNLVQMVEVFLSELNYVKQIRSSLNYTNVSTSPWAENFLDVDSWTNYEFNIRNYLMSLVENVDYELGHGVTIILLVIHGTLFVVGFVGNVTLFIIFILHREMLSSNNIIILNLAVGDTFSLVSNIVVSYVNNLSDTLVGGYLECLSLTLFIPLSTGVCVYSVTMLSIQRYLAVISVGKCIGCRILKCCNSLLFIAVVWVLACASAIPQFLQTDFHEDYCAVQLTKFRTLLNVIVYCVIPIVIMAAFSMLTSRAMRHSVRNMPGEVMGQKNARSARSRSANILIGLIVIFAISYIPYYMLFFAYIYFDLEKLGFNQMFTISYTLVFVNSCCNPIALYAASGNFRHYFNQHLLGCCFVKLRNCGGILRRVNGSQSTQRSQINSSEL